MRAQIKIKKNLSKLFLDQIKPLCRIFKSLVFSLKKELVTVQAVPIQNGWITTKADIKQSCNHLINLW